MALEQDLALPDYLTPREPQTPLPLSLAQARTPAEPQATKAAPAGPDLSTAPKWADIEAKPEYKAMSPDKQAQAKATYFDYWIAPNAGQQAASLRQQFMATPAASAPAQQRTQQPQQQTDGTSRGIVSDVGNLFGMGVNSMAQDVRELVGRIPGVGKTVVAKMDAIDKWASGKSSDELLKGNIKSAQERLTPEMQAAGDKKWWDSDKGTFGDAWSDPRSYVSGVVQSLPEQALTMLPAMRLAKGIYASKIAAGVAPEVAAAASARAATIAGGVSEGALGGAQSSRQVRDKIMEMKPEQLQNSEALKSLVTQGMSFDQAREQLANDSATQAFILAGITTGMFGGMGDRMLAKAITEGVGKNVAGRVAKGVVGEGLMEEFPQSYTQAVSENIAMRRADPSIGITDDALNQGLGGLAVGALQGGGMAAGFGRNAPAKPATPAPATAEAPAEPTAAHVTVDGRLELDGATDHSVERDAPLLAAMREATLKQAGTPADAAAAQAPTAEQPAQAPAPAEPVPANVHPSQAAADAIVRQVAQEAGIPLESVLPTPAAPATAQQTQPTQQPTDTTQATDQDVLDFAASRYQQLRQKRDGQVQTVMTDSGLADEEVPGVGLSQRDAQEMAALEAHRGDPNALRALYGFDQQSMAPTAPADALNAQQAAMPGQVAPEAVMPAADAQAPTQGGQIASMPSDAGSPMFNTATTAQTAPSGAPAFTNRDTSTALATPAQRENIAALETLYDTANQPAIASGQAPSASVVHPFAPAQLPDSEGIAAIAGAFGREVVGFSVNPGQQSAQFGSFNGVTWPSGTGNRVFINADTTRPHLAVLGHEIAHQMAKTRPDLYARMVDAIRPYIDQRTYQSDFARSGVAKGAVSASMSMERRGAAVREEFIGEVLSDGFMDVNFWRALGAKNKELLAQVHDFVARMLQKVFSTVGYTAKTAQYLTDYQRVMQIAGEVMAEYGIGQPRTNTPAAADIKFNAKGDQRDANRQEPGTTTRTQREAIEKEFGEAAFTRFNWLHKSIGTQYHKAAISPEFKRVFDTANAMESTGTQVAVRTAERAPGVLPKALNLVTAAKQLAYGRKAAKEMQAATTAILEGTTFGKTVLDGKVWSDDELRSRFKMSDQGIDLYRQMRASIDAGVREVAVAEVYAMSALYLKASDRAAVRELMIDDPEAGIAKLRQQLDAGIALNRKAIALKKHTGADAHLASIEEALKDQEDTKRRVDEVLDFAKTLAEVGYAPLMRFGKYTVTVQEIDPATGHLLRDSNGDPVPTVYFERFETEAEARDAYFAQGARFAGMSDRIRISTGTVNEQEHKLYAGVSPEVVALFAEKIGNKAFEQLLTKVAVSDQSILKRQLNRKNIPGYSQEYDRVLAKFVTSSGRWAASKYFMSDLKKSVKHIRERDVQAEAQKLVSYITDQRVDTGEDVAAAVSSLAFTVFLGGPTNVASAFVNFLQVGTLLPQHLVKTTSTAKAMAAITSAYRAAVGRKELPKDLRTALKKAEQEGKVDAQEVHHLYNIGIQGIQAVVTDYVSRVPGGHAASKALVSARHRLQAAGVLWGAMFGAVESLNRRVTFIAAWNVAQAEGLADPFTYAVKAVDETQGIYTKANRQNLGRNAMGRMLTTFKMVPAMWVEIMVRNLKYGGKPGYYAAALQLATMILLAGVGGLPFEDDLIDIIDSVAQAMGFNWNTKQEREKWAKETFGQLWGEAVVSGMSAFLPVDLGARLGVANLIPATGMFKKSNVGRREREAAELFGVGGSLAMMGVDAFDAANAGRMDRAALALAPMSVRNLAQGVEMMATGEARDPATGKKKMNATTGEGAFKAMGFNPQSLAQSGQARFYESQNTALAKITAKQVTDDWAEGIATNNQKLIDKAQADMEDWNRKNPEYPIYPSPDELRNKARQYLLDADQRMLKATPKRWRGTTYQNLGLGDVGQ